MKKNVLTQSKKKSVKIEAEYARNDTFSVHYNFYFVMCVFFLITVY